MSKFEAYDLNMQPRTEGPVAPNPAQPWVRLGYVLESSYRTFFPEELGTFADGALLALRMRIPTHHVALRRAEGPSRRVYLQ